MFWNMLLAIVAGAALGGLWPEAGRAVSFLGDIFLRSLLMLVVPLLMTSIISGVARLGGLADLGGLSSRTIGYYLFTTGMAVALGMVLVAWVRPGHADTEEERLLLRGGFLAREMPYRIEGTRIETATPLPPRLFQDRFAIRLLDQPFVGRLKRSETGLEVEKWETADAAAAPLRESGRGLRLDLTVAPKVEGKGKSWQEVLKSLVSSFFPRNLFDAMAHNDVVGLLLFSLLVGFLLSRGGPSLESVRTFIDGLNEIMMKLVGLLMTVAPLGVFALLAGRMGDAGGLDGFAPEFIRVGKYAATVVVGLLIHGGLVLPLLLRIWGKREVIPFTRGMMPSLLTAFSTSSSSATLPLTLECAVKNNRLSDRICSFVISLGATMNMNGTALYEAVAAVFIAQVYGIELSTLQWLLVFLTATVAAVGAAGIPEAGLVTMVMVLQAVGLPLEGISMLLVIDWFLDRCRTVVNVWGDAVGAAVMEQRFFKKRTG